MDKEYWISAKKILDGYYDISKSQLYKLAREQKIQSKKFNTKTHFMASDIEALGYVPFTNEKKCTENTEEILENNLIAQSKQNVKSEAMNELLKITKFLIDERNAQQKKSKLNPFFKWISVLAALAILTFGIFGPGGFLEIFENSEEAKNKAIFSLMAENNKSNQKIFNEIIREKKKNEQNRQNAQLKKLVDETKEVQISLKSLD